MIWVPYNIESSGPSRRSRNTVLTVALLIAFFICLTWTGISSSTNPSIRERSVVFLKSWLANSSTALSRSFPVRLPTTANRFLTTQDRIAYQRAIEEAYWRHRVWPKENPGSKPSLAELISLSQIEQKVQAYLSKSQALEDYWQSPITSDQLQGELDRLGRDTHDPAMLRELYQALDNDPFVIAECLARPLLVDRIIRSLYDFDEKLHEQYKWRARTELAGHPTLAEIRAAGGGEYSEVEFVKGRDEKTTSLSAQRATEIVLTAEEWTDRISRLSGLFYQSRRDESRSTILIAAANRSKGTSDRSDVDELRVGVVSELQEDEQSFYVATIIEKRDDWLKVGYVHWKKQPFESWWSSVVQLNKDSDPAVAHEYRLTTPNSPQGSCTDNTWKATYPGPPTARAYHTAVWTGSEMIVWAGVESVNGGGRVNTGSRYNPTTDTWNATNWATAPAVRYSHSAIWTGTEMIVWGGYNGSYLNSGGRYNPTSDSWTATSTAGAPSPRYDAKAFWTGSEMLIWGVGASVNGPNNTGGRYNPVSNTWVATTTSNAPTPRSNVSAVWTGSEMIVWGGTEFGGVLPVTGGRYNPTTNTWTATSTASTPAGRDAPSAVWSGSEMLVWGGRDSNDYVNTGGRYNPGTNTWSSMSTSGTASLRSEQTVVWTGSGMIVWGGRLEMFPLATGARYDPVADAWSPTSTIAAPGGRASHTAVWTGSEMIVWGGYILSSGNPPNPVFKTGGRYNPNSNTWTPTSTAGPLSVRRAHSAVWTGAEMIVWGGRVVNELLNTGDKYTGATDSWTPITILNAPDGREAHSTVWTGNEMIVWGGSDFGGTNTGGRYNPTADTWTATSTTNAAAPRNFHSAVWTGTTMIIWGGYSFAPLDTGARYDPASNTWTPTSSVAVPEPRRRHSAIWTGTEMIVWGGDQNPTRVGTGGRYNPNSDSWAAVTTIGAPTGRILHSAIWTGSEMVIWGGDDLSIVNSGGRYNPTSNAWRDTSLTGVPTRRYGHTTVWTGSEMIVWAGQLNVELNTGGRYNPLTDIWSTTALNDSTPTGRYTHSAVWTGSQMIVWGGLGSNPVFHDDGGRYCAVTAPSGLTISGRIVDESGNRLSAIAVALSGTTSGNTTTDVNGDFSFSNPPSGGTYTITPSSISFTFSPASQTFANLIDNRIANFAGTRATVRITGKVIDGNSVGLSSVLMTLLKNNANPVTAVTDPLGNYSFDNLSPATNYVVTPSGTFTPSSQTFSNLNTNAAANFQNAPLIPPQCNTPDLGAAINFSTGSSPTAVSMGDFNADRKLDLVVANQGSANVSILLGTGTGSFGAATTFPTASGSAYVAIADFNGDGKLDLAVANRTANNISVLLGTGTGSFGAATNFAVGSVPSSVAAGDFNGDGNVDLAAGNVTSGNVSVLLGTGTGSFGAATNFGVGASPATVSVGDLNGDRKLDLVVANGNSNSVSLLLGTGTGSFGSAINFTVASPSALAVADFNADGKLDLAVASSSAGNVSILLGNGSGGFSAPTSFVVASPIRLAVGDFNGDSKLDLASADFTANNVSILLGTGTGSFTAATNFSAGATSVFVAAGDVNGDGKLDLAVANINSANVSVLLNNGSQCNTQSGLTIFGQIKSANNAPLADVTVTLSGPITRVTQTDASGNYSFPNLVPGGNYTVTVQSSYFVFAPSRADFFNLSSSEVANFIAAPLAVPSPLPPPSDDFSSPTRDASKWSIGTQSSPTVSFDPLVTTAQVNGQLVITPLTQASGLHYAGYVSANSFDLRNGKASVELVKAGTGGVDTIFAIGADVDNFYRFLVHTAGPGTALAPTAKGRDGIERPLDTTVAQLIFQVNVSGMLTSLSLNYDPVQHRFMRFRHLPAMNSIVFETSPNDVDYTVQHTVVLQKSVSALTAELSAGTSNPANPGPTIFDNFGLVTSTFQFSTGSYAVNEGDGSLLITVTRAGSLADAAAVDFATADGTARQKTKYTSAAGTLSFAAGIASRTFRVLLVDNQIAEGDQTVNLLLSNPFGSGLSNPGRAVLTISDNDTTLATTNQLDEAQYFVTQHYYDFLSRVPDQGGLDYWTSQITFCGTDINCLRAQRITVSNAFFYEQEYQQTGSYVVRLYRAAYGNNQPIPNNDANPAFPNENKKLVNYSVFSVDRARVRGGPTLAQTQLDLANAFVLRSQFLTRYPSTLIGPAYVDALLAGINTDIGVDLSSQRQALIDLYNQPGLAGGRGAVLYRVADDNAGNPINNRAFIDAEYNQAFVLTQYFGYLRRNPDIGGYIFWLGQVNSAPLRALEKQRAMVCSFITSTEYQQRFSPVVTHNNTECQ